MNKLIDAIFICSSLVFNISVSSLYIATKLGNMVLVQVFGGIVISLIVPFIVTLLGYFKEKANKRTIVSNGIIIIYLFMELLLDYILRMPFREILAFHGPYIIIFYASLFSMLAVTFEKDKKMGYFLLGTFLLLMACLIYYLLPL